MLLTTRVKLVLSSSPGTAIPGVKVSLYDRDIQNEDDFLATAVTDDHGEIYFSSTPNNTLTPKRRNYGAWNRCPTCTSKCTMLKDRWCSPQGQKHWKTSFPNSSLSP